MPGFERTEQAADLFAKLICCANPKCLQESDQLQTLGTACKHAFCWDCINFYSNLDTFVVCPVCACPLEIHKPKAAQIFNNLAQHINEFKLLLQELSPYISFRFTENTSPSEEINVATYNDANWHEYERALRSEGAAATSTIQQTQMLFENCSKDVISDDHCARSEAINEFISTQKFSVAEQNDVVMEDFPESDFSEELNDTPPPQLRDELLESRNLVVNDSQCKLPGCPNVSSVEEITEAATSGQITDTVPQFGQPIMTSTQQTPLFLTQAAHAHNKIFGREDNQEIKTYPYKETYNYFREKPATTFDLRGRKVSDAPWLDLQKKHTYLQKDLGEVKCNDNDSSASGVSQITPKPGPKVKSRSPSLARKSPFSASWTHANANDPVITAVIAGNLEDVQHAIEAGYDVNRRDDKKRTPLFIAVEMGRLDICELLVERGGAVINANCGVECNTALHVAVSHGNEEIVKYLLSKGASKTIRNIRQQTPSQLAQSYSPLRILVEKYRSHPRQPLVARLPDVYVVCLAREVKKTLTYHDQSVLSKLMVVVEHCDELTTHYVVSTDENDAASVDANLLRAMMQNTRIMGSMWLNECIRLGKPLPHTNYEVSKLRYRGNDIVHDSLSRCRKSKERMEPGLFHGCTFYFLAKKYKGIDDRRLLPDLIRLGGGELSTTEPVFIRGAPAPFHAPHLSSPIFIVYDVTVTKNIPNVFHRYPARYNLISAQWIIESVIEYSIKPIS